MGEETIYYLQDLEITQPTWGHTARLWVKKELMGPGFCFYCNGGRGPRVSQAHSLLVFIALEWEFKAPEKTSGSNAQLSNSTKISTTKSLNMGGGLALFLVLWLAMCLLEIVIFEVNASAIIVQLKYLHYKK